MGVVDNIQHRYAAVKRFIEAHLETYTIVTLCLYSFLIDFRPSQSYIMDYSLEKNPNITIETFHTKILPFRTYSYIFALLPSMLIMDYIKYKLGIILSALFLVIAYSCNLRIFTVVNFQIVEILFGFSASLRIALLTYSFACFPIAYYRKLTGYVRGFLLAGCLLSAVLAQILVSILKMAAEQGYVRGFLLVGRLLSAVLAQILVSTDTTSLTTLNSVSLLAVCLAFMISLLIPAPPPKTVVVSRMGIVPVSDHVITVSRRLQYTDSRPDVSQRPDVSRTTSGELRPVRASAILDSYEYDESPFDDSYVEGDRQSMQRTAYQTTSEEPGIGRNGDGVGCNDLGGRISKGTHVDVQCARESEQTVSNMQQTREHHTLNTNEHHTAQRSHLHHISSSPVNGDIVVHGDVNRLNFDSQNSELQPSELVDLEELELNDNSNLRIVQNGTAVLELNSEAISQSESAINTHEQSDITLPMPTTRHKSTNPCVLCLQRNFGPIITDISACYSDLYVLKLSVWWMISSAVYMQLVSYAPVQWVVLAGEEADINKGGVQAVGYFLGCIAAFACAFWQWQWKVFNDLLIACVATVTGTLLIITSQLQYLYLSYFAYVIFTSLYYMTITIASFEIASQLTCEKYALIFGNNFLVGALVHCALMLAFIVVPVHDAYTSTLFLVNGCLLMCVALAMCVVIVQDLCRLGPSAYASSIRQRPYGEIAQHVHI